MVATAKVPFDVVLRICPFPVAWLPGQRRCRSRCRALLQCASRDAFGDLPKRVDGCLASCRALSRLLMGRRSLLNRLAGSRPRGLSRCRCSIRDGNASQDSFPDSMPSCARARASLHHVDAAETDRCRPEQCGHCGDRFRAAFRASSRGNRRQRSGEPADLLDVPRPASASFGLFSARPEGVTEIFASEAVFAGHVDVRP